LTLSGAGAVPSNETLPEREAVPVVAPEAAAEAAAPVVAAAGAEAAALGDSPPPQATAAPSRPRAERARKFLMIIAGLLNYG
jgi:hypothetical protein